MDRPPAPLLLGAAATLAMGTPFWLIAVAQQAMPTATMAAGRVVLAAVTLTVVLAVVTRQRPWGAWSEIVGLVRLRPYSLAAGAAGAAVLPNLFLGAAERHVPTGTIAVILAMTPVWIALAVSVQPSERLSARQCLALPSAVAGVILVCTEAVPPQALPWCLLPLAASFAYAGASLVLRARLAAVSPLGVTAAEMMLASVVLVPVAGLVGGETHWDPEAWAAMVAAGAGCSGLGLLAYNSLVQHVGPARSAIVSYPSVIVSVALGAALLDEPLTVRGVTGVAVIVAAVVVFLLPARTVTGLVVPPFRKERLMLELCILGFLAESPLHAYELRRRIAALTGHVRPVSDGALLPAIKRLAAPGWLTRAPEAGNGGPARVVLHLTEDGHTELLRRLASADNADVTDRNRWFAVLAFLHHLTDTNQQRALLKRRLDFLEDPGRGFFTAADDRTSLFRQGMATMATATWKAEHAWLRSTLASLAA